ncbi:hypothetical protein [Hymenobacter sp. BT491]|uniref:hypothetical protein n=1 Tax=Hymenobacter sp. BT491 TaxID=2766779 RepID=UPI0016539E24|nr:hypothetical protein [Hymenobacter sp. BT491]MBC6988945.1 hypothetical protein [Hymenobacter sp. BT491]
MTVFLMVSPSPFPARPFPYDEIEEVKKKQKRIRLQIELAKATINELDAQEKELEDSLWVCVAWADLEAYLKKNGQGEHYDLNPEVRSANGTYVDYCKLNDQGELQVGSYRNNDRFPRGGLLRVRKDLKAFYSGGDM